jgi:hypothetical protein
VTFVGSAEGVPAEAPPSHFAFRVLASSWSLEAKPSSSATMTKYDRIRSFRNGAPQAGGGRSRGLIAKPDHRPYRTTRDASLSSSIVQKRDPDGRNITYYYDESANQEERHERAVVNVDWFFFYPSSSSSRLQVDVPSRSPFSASVAKCRDRRFELLGASVARDGIAARRHLLYEWSASTRIRIIW